MKLRIKEMLYGLMMMICGLIWIWTISTPINVQAVTEISAVPISSRVLDSGPLLQNSTVTLRCSAQEARDGVTSHYILNHNGVLNNVTVTCRPVKYPFLVRIIGYVPRTGRLFTHYAKLTKDITEFNTTQPVDALTNDASAMLDPSGRKLLSIDNGGVKVKYIVPKVRRPPRESLSPTARRLLYDWHSDIYNTDENGEPTVGVGEAAGNYVANIACSVPFVDAIADAFSPGACGGPYVTQSDFNNFKNETGEAFNRVYQFDQQTYTTLQHIAAFDTTVNARFDTLAAREAQQDIVNANAVQFAQNQVVTNQILATDMNKLSDSVTTRIEAAFSNMRDISGQLADAVVTENTDFARLSHQMMQIFNLTMQIQAEGHAEFKRLNGQSLQQFNIISDNLNKVIRLIEAQIHGDNYKMALIPLMRRTITALRATGDLVPFLHDIGSDPADNLQNLPSSIAQRVMDIQGYQYAYTHPTGNIPKATDTRLALFCSSAYLVLHQETVSEYTEVTSKLGPPACSTTDQANNYCACFYRVQEQECSIKNAGVGLETTPNTTAMEYWSSVKDPTLDAATCIDGTIVSGSLHDTYIKTPQEFLTFQENICARGVRTDFNSQKYRVHSGIRKRAIDVPFNSAACTSDLSTLMYPPAEGPYTILFATARQMVWSWNNQVKNLTHLTGQLIGQIPNEVQYKTYPWIRLHNGEFSEIRTASFMAYPPINPSDTYGDMVPIWSMRAQTPVVQMQYSINGGATITVDGTANDPSADEFLPGGLTTMVGRPYDMWDGTSEFYNVDPDQLPITPVSEQTCGTIVYTRIDDWRRFSLQNWTLFYNDTEFIHACGRNHPGLYTQPLDTTPGSPTQGQCDTTTVSIPNGPWCDRFQHYAVTADSQTETVNWFARNALPTFTFTLPSGTLTDLVGSYCPDHLQVRHALDIIGIRLSNPIQDDNDLRIVQTGGCPRTTDIRLAPLASTTILIEYCPHTPVGQTEHLLIYYNAGNGYTLCDGQVNVTVGHPNDSAYPASTALTATLTTTIVDRLSAAISNSLNAVLNRQLEIMELNMKTWDRHGFVLDPIIESDRQNLIDRIHNTQVSIDANMTANNNLIFNASADIQSHQEASSTNIANMANATEQAKGYTDQLNEENIMSKPILEQIYTDLNRLNDSLSDEWLAIFRVVQDAHKKNGGGGGSSLFSGLGSFLANAVKWTEEEGEKLAGWLPGAANSILSPITGIIKGVGDTVGSVFSVIQTVIQYALIAVVVFALGYGGYWIYKKCKPNKPDPSSNRSVEMTNISTSAPSSTSSASSSSTPQGPPHPSTAPPGGKSLPSSTDSGESRRHQSKRGHARVNVLTDHFSPPPQVSLTYNSLLEP